ncbi:MAG: hypothetical protein K940chlam6_01635 [Chlamydiae bacterium]|nr:hypothetical protein [Chlamydiota bacterium]
MASLKVVLTKDARPIKTMPNRRPGLASGYCRSFSSLLALVVLILLWLLEIKLKTMWLVGLLLGSQLVAVVLYNFWVDYSRNFDDSTNFSKKLSPELSETKAAENATSFQKASFSCGLLSGASSSIGLFPHLLFLLSLYVMKKPAPLGFLILTYIASIFLSEYIFWAILRPLHKSAQIV